MADRQQDDLFNRLFNALHTGANKDGVVADDAFSKVMDDAFGNAQKVQQAQRNPKNDISHVIDFLRNVGSIK